MTEERAGDKRNKLSILRMDVPSIDLRTMLTGVAVAISALSAWFAHKMWRDTYRPIVTVFADDIGGANFNLIVSNSGNRPAKNICLSITDEDLYKLVSPNSSDASRGLVEDLFSEEAKIPILDGGEKLSSGLGTSTASQCENQSIEYAVTVDITVKYESLNGQLFVDTVPFKVYARDGFGGSSWKNST